jgi:hypothetical protein
VHVVRGYLNLAKGRETQIINGYKEQKLASEAASQKAMLAAKSR